MHGNIQSLTCRGLSIRIHEIGTTTLALCLLSLAGLPLPPRAAFLPVFPSLLLAIPSTVGCSTPERMLLLSVTHRFHRNRHQINFSDTLDLIRLLLERHEPFSDLYRRVLMHSDLTSFKLLRARGELLQQRKSFLEEINQSVYVCCNFSLHKQWEPVVQKNPPGKPADSTSPDLQDWGNKLLLCCCIWMLRGWVSASFCHTSR